MKTIAEIIDMVEAYGRLNRCGDFHGMLADIERAIKERDAQAALSVDRDAARFRYMRDHLCTCQADSLGPIFRIDVRIDTRTAHLPWALEAAVDRCIAGATPKEQA